MSPYGRAWQPPVPVKPLVMIAEGQAWRLLGVSCLSVLGGAALVVVGLVTGFLAIIGLVLFVMGCIGMVAGLVRAINPTGHASIARLGRTSDERMTALRGIEQELAEPGTWRASTAAGGQVFLSRSWLVLHDATNLVIAYRDDVLWLWQAEKKKRWSSSLSIKMHTRRTTAAEEMEIGPLDGWLLPTLTQAFPWAMVGYDARWEATPRGYLAAEIDRRRAAGSPT
ncbi:MAG TPA: hypothetical protein VF316_22520 [Polyangiaceae bacterium]